MQTTANQERLHEGWCFKMHEPMENEVKTSLSPLVFFAVKACCFPQLMGTEPDVRKCYWKGERIRITEREKSF